jgi:protocatechuate 3,4-dioxygenase beta subunit
MKAAGFLLLALNAGAQTAPPDQTGSVSGVVTDAVTHMPVKKTMVTINPNGNFSGRVQPQGATTDAAGAFTLTNLQAGQYRLMFQHQSYPQARFGGVAKNIEIKAGESAGPVNVELIPGAAVSGHIVDEDGDPVSNCYVQVHPAKNLDQGVPMMGSSNSNQDGEWRAFGIAPGKYTLSAQCGHAVFQPRPFSAGPDPAPTRAYPTQYYPLASDVKGAQVVELTAGNEKSGIDFQLSPMPVTQVRGAFAPGGADWRGAPLMMQMISLAEHGANRGGNNIGGAPNLEKGTFEFRQVFPGSYILVAFSQGAEDGRVGAWQRVDVGDKPVELALELKHAFDLSGKVEIEANANSTHPVTPNQINIQLVSQYEFGVPYPQGQVNDDGTFTLKGVLPAPWRLQVNAPFAFVKTAWLGSTDVTNAPLDLSSGAAGSLRILVSTNTGTIRGTAPAGHAVYAQRVDEETPFRGSQGTGVDQNGQYRFEGLAPGKYRLTVQDPGVPIPDEGGQEITVREGETVMADLKAPPAP